jgi:hypothetical protein
LRHRIKFPAAFADRCARARSIGVDVLTRQRLNTNLVKDFRIVLDGHGPWLADRNSSRFAATALNLMRNILICSSRACCSAPGGSLRAVSKSLAAIFSRSCILSPTAFRSAEHNRSEEALSVRYPTQGEQRWRAMRRPGSTGTPIARRPNPHQRPSASRQTAIREGLWSRAFF